MQGGIRWNAWDSVLEGFCRLVVGLDVQDRVSLKAIPFVEESNFALWKGPNENMWTNTQWRIKLPKQKIQSLNWKDIWTIGLLRVNLWHMHSLITEILMTSRSVDVEQVSCLYISSKSRKQRTKSLLESVIRVICDTLMSQNKYL